MIVRSTSCVVLLVRLLDESFLDRYEGPRKTLSTTVVGPYTSSHSSHCQVKFDFKTLRLHANFDRWFQNLGSTAHQIPTRIYDVRVLVLSFQYAAGLRVLLVVKRKSQKERKERQESNKKLTQQEGKDNRIKSVLHCIVVSSGDYNM